MIKNTNGWTLKMYRSKYEHQHYSNIGHVKLKISVMVGVIINVILLMRSEKKKKHYSNIASSFHYLLQLYVLIIM